MAARASLVTGGSGYIASHIVQQLLERNERVHATVRSLQNTQKTQHLLDMQSRWPDQLTLFEADLLVPGSFAAATQGCSVVYHVASPFLLEEQICDAQKDVVEPALHGTQNVLDAVRTTASVRVVVVTSTVGAIFGDYADVTTRMTAQTLAEEYFNSTSSVSHNAYHYAKTLAEKAAWTAHAAQPQPPRWKLVTINPGLVLGPSLARWPASESGSLFLIDELLRGRLFFGVPNLWFTVVDVREVAAAHVRAADAPGSHGRYIVAERQMHAFVEFARILRRLHNAWSIPAHATPDFVVRFVGPLFGLTRKWMDLNLGIRFQIDNRRSVEELNIVYRPLEETLRDHYQSWIAQRRVDQQ